MAEYVLNERTRTRRDWLATEHRSRLRRTGEGPQAAERWLFADSMSTATPPEVQGEIITPPEDRLSLCAAALRQSALRRADRSEEHTSELQSLMRISYAVFCLKKKKKPKPK